MVATTYVRDMAASCAFYQALGFGEESSGHNELSAWVLLRHTGHSVLLVTSTPAPEIPALPLLFYLFVDDAAATVQALDDGRYPTTHMGYPPHAAGGEIKTQDPDGNTILLGQVEPADAPTPPRDDPARRFSVLREAAALARERAHPNMMCQIGDGAGGDCGRPAEVKLADSWGDCAWACLLHAEETMLGARTVFIANQDEQDGLQQFLANRGRY
jgi:catechol 2,3-dioxygenase-like lactoylglutathione lyase family enzyme